MSAPEEKPAVDAILMKVLEAVPFQLTTDGGVEDARRRFRDLPRRGVHPDVRSEDRTIDGPAGPIPIRVYWPPTDGSALPVVVFIHGGGWCVGDLDTYERLAVAGDSAGGNLAAVVSLVPGRAPDLVGMPPAYIAIAGHDPLRDDGACYAELLAAAGVPVELHNAGTLVHGYVGYTGVVPAATHATQRGLAALREVLHSR